MLEIIENKKIESKLRIIGYENKKKKLRNIGEIIFGEAFIEKRKKFFIKGTIFLHGEPGTGKTSLAYYLGDYLKKTYGIESYKVNVHNLIEADLGKTTKNMHKTLEEIKIKANKYGVLVILDEIDRICVDRGNQNELSELKRSMIAFMDFLDEISSEDKMIIIGITNIFEQIDKAVIRRFEFIEKIEPTIEQLKEYLEKLLEQVEIKFDLKNIDEKFYKDYKTCDRIQNFIKSFFLEELELSNVKKTAFLDEKLIEYFKGEGYVNEINGSKI